MPYSRHQALWQTPEWPGRPSLYRRKTKVPPQLIRYTILSCSYNRAAKLKSCQRINRCLRGRAKLNIHRILHDSSNSCGVLRERTSVSFADASDFKWLCTIRLGSVSICRLLICTRSCYELGSVKKADAV